MALHRQGSGSWQVGIDPFGTAFRAQDRGNGDQKSPLSGRHPNNSRFTEASSRNAMKANRGKRLPRPTRFRQCGIGLFIFLLLCVVVVTILGGDYLFSTGRSSKTKHGPHDFFDNQDHSILFSLWNLGTKSTGSTKDNTTDLGGDVGNGDSTRHDGRERALKFGKTFVGKEDLLDRDSREWDSDDRMRDRSLDYVAKDPDAIIKRDKRAYKDADTTVKYESQSHLHKRFDLQRHQSGTTKLSGRNGGLYSERGHKEFQMYGEQLETASKWEFDSKKKKSVLDFENGNWHRRENIDGNSLYNKDHDQASVSTTTEKQRKSTGTSIFEEYDSDDEYDDSGDEVASLVESANSVEEEHSGVKSADELPGMLEDSLAISHQAKVLNDRDTAEGISFMLETKADKGLNNLHAQNDTRSQSRQKRHAVPQRLRRRTRRHGRAGHPCEIDFLETTRGLIEPEADFRFANFSLKYIEMEEPQGGSDWEPRFAGHQTLQQREQSFIATDQTIHCGFVQGTGSLGKTGFDLAQEDDQFLNTCKIAVSSCIFASSDNIRSPRGKKLTGSFKKDVCFVMFVDQRTLDVMKQEGQELDDKGYLGLWKVIVVRNVPYADARRTGKIPKFLTHRLFPAARYSIWLDSKLRLQSDPVLILEYFLWRGGYEYAISNHYDRHCVWEEVQQNKKLNKYNHSVIDEQFAFYQADGLYRFNVSDPNKLLPSHVPEGSFIIRAHTPMSNLFSCLWFNEVERFTPRDQLSFAYTYMKLVRSNPDKHFYFNMFKDCERKTITKLFRHRRNASSLV